MNSRDTSMSKNSKRTPFSEKTYLFSEINYENDISNENKTLFKQESYLEDNINLFCLDQLPSELIFYIVTHLLTLNELEFLEKKTSKKLIQFNNVKDRKDTEFSSISFSDIEKKEIFEHAKKTTYKSILLLRSTCKTMNNLILDNPVGRSTKIMIVNRP